MPDRCLTIYPHWAWAIIHGRKRIENRTWRTDYRGRLWIHSGRRRTPEASDLDLLPDLPAPDSLVTGAIIGHVSLVDVVPLHEVSGRPFASGPWCWVLESPTPVDPIPCSGQVSLWTPPRRALVAVRRIRNPR